MKPKQVAMFPTGDDLPLFSGTPQFANVEAYAPKEQPHQGQLPGTPAIDWTELGKEKGPCQ